MSEHEIREPIQKRSIEKKEKIIKSGFDLICDKGYYGTNTAEIAKAAGVSTGIVYNYFSDKHDIFIEGLKKFSDRIFYPIIEVTNENITKTNFNQILKKIINTLIESHRLSQSAHEEITAMTHSDKEVATLFHKREMEITDILTNVLINNGFDKTNLKEKVHISIGLTDNLCHEIIYHKHDEINYDVMISLVIKSISDLILN